MKHLDLIRKGWEAAGRFAQWWCTSIQPGSGANFRGPRSLSSLETSDPDPNSICGTLAPDWQLRRCAEVLGI